MDFRNQKFEIAISYSGTNRDFVRKVDEHLMEYLDTSEVFYDERYTAHMARPNLDGVLRKLYRDRARLVVIFMSEGYGDSPWCAVELNAAREAYQAKPESAPMLFSADPPRQHGFTMDHAHPIDDQEPAEIAKLILEQLKSRHKRLTLKSYSLRRRNHVFGILGTLIALAVAVFFALESRTVGADETPGIISMVIFVISSLVLTFCGYRFIALGRKPPEYQSPPSHAYANGESTPIPHGGGGSEQAWQIYARELEEYHERIRIEQAGMMRNQRESRFILLWSIILSVVLAIVHFVTELAIRHTDKESGGPVSFLEAAIPSGKEKTPVSKPWDLLRDLEIYSAHWQIGLLYIGITSLVCFWIANRVQFPLRSCLFLGIWPALYVGLVYVLFSAAQNYQGLFQSDPPDSIHSFTGEPGNFYVIVHIVLIPAACLVCAAVAGIFGRIARGPIRKAPESPHQASLESGLGQ